jgi:hypothetical protein
MPGRGRARALSARAIAARDHCSGDVELRGLELPRMTTSMRVDQDKTYARVRPGHIAGPVSNANHRHQPSPARARCGSGHTVGMVIYATGRGRQFLERLKLRLR